MVERYHGFKSATGEKFDSWDEAALDEATLLFHKMLPAQAGKLAPVIAADMANMFMTEDPEFSDALVSLIQLARDRPQTEITEPPLLVEDQRERLGNGWGWRSFLDRIVTSRPKANDNQREAA